MFRPAGLTLRRPKRGLKPRDYILDRRLTSLWSVASAGLDAEDVHLGFKALPEIEIACSEFEPALRLLVNIEAAADLYKPSVVETNLAFVKSALDLPVHHDIELQ